MSMSKQPVTVTVLATTLALAFSSLPARAQFDFLKMDSAAEFGSPQAATVSSLARANRLVGTYPMLSPTQQAAWSARVANPYPGTEVPLDHDLIVGLFGLFEGPETPKSVEEWQLWHDALIILKNALPGDPQVADAARTVLTADLPEVILFLPHENLFAAALGALLSTGRDADLAFVVDTEKETFWAARANQTRLAETGIFEGEPDAAVLALRGKAPWILALNRPSEAVPFIESCLRTESNATYAQYLSNMLETAKAKSSEETGKPVPHGRPIPDPFLDALSSGGPVTPIDMHTVLSHQDLATLRPSLAKLTRQKTVTQSDLDLCAIVADVSDRGQEERIEACRQLRNASGLPFEWRRWLTLTHVLLAGSLNLPGEMQDVATDWLNQYPTDWDHLPESWRTTRWREINANVRLRCYLAHAYTYVENDQFNWPMADRLRMTRGVMAPIFEVENAKEQDVVFAKIFYGRAMRTATAKWATAEARQAKSDEDRQTIRDAAEAAESDLARERLAQLEASALAIRGLTDKPIRTDHARGIIRNPHEVLAAVLAEKGPLQADMARREQQQASKEASQAAELVENVWRDMEAGTQQ
ncbi:MAG: hypothetical protein GY851_03665 [bacterium]|nr:hypothetical protein [bacterium]